MKKSTILRFTASVIATGMALSSNVVLAAPPSSAEVIDGDGGTGVVITDAAPAGTTNPNVVRSNGSPSVTIGAENTQTIFSDFATRGGDGSGGGAGLGGVFFVDDGRALTLSNVTFRNNTAEGGTGGVGSVGGSMNGLVSPGTAATGQDGANSNPGFANFDGGKGGPGYGGYNGANASLGVGGQGGTGGGGSGGLAITADTVLNALNVAYDTAKSIKSIREGSDLVEIAAQMTALSAAAAAGVNVGGPTTAGLAPSFALLAAKFGEMAAAEAADSVEEFVRLAADTAYNVAMTITAYQVGAAGVGGDGGSGGTGGDGSRFYSGGVGGAGGFGGFAVGTSGAVGGGGGSGGSGGVSGFGAGGASGGSAGSGGDSGSAGGVSGAYLDGDAGQGGEAGFGAGVGSDGSDAGGAGGSGYGGAIFVARGGTLNITRNALFTDNYVLGGSSDNGGEAGEGAGTDLFMMKGSNVNLLPGAGNTIRFEGSIADDSAASIGGASYRSGAGANIQIGGGGLVQFAGDNAYSGTTFISGATLEADIGVGVNFDSRITFNGAGTIAGTGAAALSNNTAGVFLTSGEIVRLVGTVLPNQVSWTGSGGFAAGEGDLSLNFGKTASTSGRTVNWGSGGFVGNGRTLIFGSEYGIGKVTLVNNVNLSSLTGRIAVYDNAEVDTDFAVMAGQFSNGGLEVNDNGYSGQLYFTNLNSLNALTVRNGLVSTSYEGSIGRMMSASTGGALTVLGGAVEFHSDERLLAVDIRQQGSVRAFENLQTGQINNAGSLIVDGTADTGSITNSGVMTVTGAVTTGAINNSGNLGFANGGVTGAIVNTSTGRLAVTGDVTTGAISNAGRASFANALSSGNIDNTGTAELFGAVVAGNVTNSGNLLFGSTSSVGSVLNSSGGTMYVNGDMTASGEVNNTEGGTVYLAGNVDTASTFTNDGLLVVVGNVTNGVERAAIRSILTTGFQDPTGVVSLGGMNGLIGNTLLVNQSGDSLYSGTIVGPGSFVKTGVGVLTLTGANTFTGGLSINAGGIDTTGGGTLANTLDVTVASGARFTVGTADEVRSITNRGTLTANADLTVTTLDNIGTASMNANFGARGNVSNASTGTLAFSAARNATVVGNISNAGTLNSASALSVSGNVTNAVGGTLNLRAGGTNTLGSLTNSGTITTAAAATVDGAFIQNAGTVTLGAALATGSLSGTGGTINLGSNSMSINQTVNGTYAGAITGAGTVTKNGAATLTLAGAAGSFAPANLAIQQGTVAVNGAGILDSALSVSIASTATLSLLSGNQTIRNLTGSGSLALNGNNLNLAQGGTYAGTVSGAGNVQVTSGTFNLSSTITSPSGTFTVQSASTMNVAATGTLNSPSVSVLGNLDVLGTVNTVSTNVNGVLHLGNSNGTVAGTLVGTTTNINGGGLLTGVGSVRGTVNVGGSSAGTLRPGNSPGTLNMDNLTLGASSTTTMEVEGAAAGTYDLINLTGALALQPSSSLIIANSNSFEMDLGQKIKLFDFAPGSVNGQFGSVSSQFARSVVYNLATGSVVGLGSLTQAQFEAAATNTSNDRGMMNALRVSSVGGVSQYYGGRLVEHLTAALASGTPNAASVVFAKASPEIYSGLGDHIKLSTLDNRMDLGAYESGGARAVYVTGSFNAGSARNKNDDGYARFKTTDQRINLGVAAQFDFGLVQLSYGNANGNLRGDYFDGKINGDQFSLGMSSPIAMNGGLRIQSRFTYGDYDFTGTRVTNAGLAKLNNLSGDTLVYGGGFEYLKAWNKVSLNANIELLGVRTSVDAFTETEAAALENLSVSAQRDHFTMLATSIKVGYKFTPRAQAFVTLSTDHDMGTDAHVVTAKVAVEDVAFTVANPGVSKTRFKAGLGTQVQLTDAITWGTEANIGNTSSYGAKTSVRIRF